MSNANTFFDLGIIELNTNSKKTPLFRQIYSSIRHGILKGEISKGFQLPSSRELAVQLGVSRMTVVNAFDQLLAEGYLTSRVGRGTFVSQNLPEERQMIRFRISPPGEESGDNGFSDVAPTTGKIRLSPTGQRISKQKHYLPDYQGDLKPFRAGVPALDCFPVEIWSKICRQQWKKFSANDLSYGHPSGYPPLKKSIVDYVQAYRGVRCDESQVIICNSTQQAIDVSTRLLVSRDDKVLFENPGYSNGRSIFEAAGARLVPMPVDENGAIVEIGIQKAPNARIAYVTPSHQFPMGVTLSIERRIELIRWARKNDSLIIEDDYDSEYRYAQRPIPSLQGLDQSGRTIYIGSCSKVIFPALSLAFVIVPKPLVEPFETAMRLSGRPSSMLDQMILNEFIRQGHFGRHLRRMRRIHQQRRTALVDAIDRYLGDKLEVIGASAGLHCTARLRTNGNDREIAAKIEQTGIIVRPLSEYVFGDRTNHGYNGLIFGFACSKPNQIRCAIRKIVDCF